MERRTIPYGDAMVLIGNAADLIRKDMAISPDVRADIDDAIADPRVPLSVDAIAAYVRGAENARRRAKEGSRS